MNKCNITPGTTQYYCPRSYNKQILTYIASKDSPTNDLKEFAINIIANVLSNNNDNIK